MIRFVAGFFVSLATLASPALAQTPEQRNACGADVRTLCAGVNPANAGIPKCLAANKDKLSDACRKALKL